MMMEAIRLSEASVLTRATRRHIPEDGITNFIQKVPDQNSLELSLYMQAIQQEEGSLLQWPWRAAGL
jgi:hypothetical protein